MHNEDKTPFLGDPIHLLVDLDKKLSNKKLKPVIGIELEFYLLRKNFSNSISESNMYSIAEIDSNYELFEEIFKSCEENNIKIESTVSEAGAGQYEIVLTHNDNLIEVATNVVFLKHIIRSIAPKVWLHSMLYV